MGVGVMGDMDMMAAMMVVARLRLKGRNVDPRSTFSLRIPRHDESLSTFF